jgi:hypothetical protein
VPQTVETPPLADLTSWRRARDAVLAAWATERGAVEKILRASPWLNRHTYRPATVEKWLGFLETPSCTLASRLADQVSWWQNLTRSGIAAGTKKGWPRADRFFDLCEELWRIDRAIVDSLAAAYYPSGLRARPCGAARRRVSQTPAHAVLLR